MTTEATTPSTCHAVEMLTLGQVKITIDGTGVTVTGQSSSHSLSDPDWQRWLRTGVRVAHWTGNGGGVVLDTAANGARRVSVRQGGRWQSGQIAPEDAEMLAKDPAAYCSGVAWLAVVAGPNE